ncbi:MAG: rRNA pseudouridine synthase [Clostridia bacterium]|nr:rRNA pseudouridine synthase [Clostridia bacterium]
MRLDKFLSITGTCSRSDAKRAIRAKNITVNGAVARIADMQVDENNDEILFLGKKIVYRKYSYIMLNKPEGVVSATDDGKDMTVLDLLPDGVRNDRMFPCGRLDKNTLGLMLITDNGDLAHRLLAPKSHVSKRYRFKSRDPISQRDADRFEGGLTLEDGYVTQPAKIELDGDGMGGIITLTEGKYHQIKRMLEALDNKITYLERITFGPLVLDNSLARGEWRYLTDAEITAIENHGKS